MQTLEKIQPTWPTARFKSKVKITNCCHIWTGRKNERGYGLFDFNGAPMLAHRFAYISENGPIENALFVLHKCDNPACVNLDHLFLGTHAENMRDMTAKVRQAHGDRHKETMRKVAARGGRHMSVTSPESVRRGSKVSGAKLTAQNVVEIRKRYASGELQKALAATFRVNQSQISDVVTRTTWKHLA